MSSGESARKYDFIIFGATGFTGQFVVDEVARLAEEEGVTWAVAGRKMDRLQKVLEQSGQRTGQHLRMCTVSVIHCSDSSYPPSANTPHMLGDTPALSGCFTYFKNV